MVGAEDDFSLSSFPMNRTNPKDLGDVSSG